MQNFKIQTVFCGIQKGDLLKLKKKICQQAKLYELMQYKNASSCLQWYVEIFEN